jgi:hypothetical protein
MTLTFGAGLAKVFPTHVLSKLQRYSGGLYMTSSTTRKALVAINTFTTWKGDGGGEVLYHPTTSADCAANAAK